jgi:methionyl-tRNA synthetase
MTENNYYITTPIYYVNDQPHIGHAYTSLACDVLARFMRLSGSSVKFLTGTDEHGQKVEKSANARNQQPQEFTDRVSAQFQNLNKIMNFSNDDFIRTTEVRHKTAVQALWKKLQDNGHIYLGKYAGWYAVRDEAFYAEAELVNGMAPTGAEVEWVEEPSYFFNLSQWQDKLLQFYEDNPQFILPLSRRNEVINFVRGGLTDLSISRTSFKWGIPVPGDEAHIIYVWLDALTNYISALGYPDLEQADFKDFWPANLHIVGKDILRFHAIYWPAFLMAAGIECPRTIFAHGWWTNEGQKISKSVGNVIDPVQLVEEFGLDQVRYFLLRETSFGSDANFSKTAMINRINSELANNIGNLVQRTLSMVCKNCDSKVPTKLSQKDITALYIEQEILQQIAVHVTAYHKKLSELDFSGAISHIIELSNSANFYIDSKAPWKLRSEDPAQMELVLYILLEVIRHIALLLLPFCPTSAVRILDLLQISPQERMLTDLTPARALLPGQLILTPEVIFTRYVS